MSKFFWMGIIVLLLIISTIFYGLKEKEKELRIYTQEQLAKTVEEKKIVQEQLAKTVEEKKIAADKLTETIKAKEIVQEELATEKEKMLALEKEVEENKRQIILTLEKLEKEIATRRKTEARLVIAMKEKKALEAKVREFTKTPKIFELEKIVIKPIPVKPTPALAGKVLAVNKEYDFVIIDLGKANNLNLGDILSVYRSDKFIGRIQVEKAKEDISAAAILPDWQGREFKEDDEVMVL